MSNYEFYQPVTKTRHQISLALMVLTLSSISLSAQDSEFSRSSIKTGLAVGGTGGEKEEGLGFMMSAGYQKSFRNGRIRLNPISWQAASVPF